MSTSSQRLRFGKSSRGFTLIELLAVITIMLVLTSVFLIRQQSFDSATVLRSLAYSIGLSVRQAQVYGTSVKDTGSFSGGSAAKAYGIYFDSGNSVTDPPTYKLFADLNNNGRYDSSPTDEMVTIFKINKGYSVTKFCGINGASQSCWTPVTPTITNLTILFRRPNSDACFATSVSPGVCAAGASPSYTSGYVQIKGGAGDTRGVTITATGQISVGNSGS